LVYRSIKVNVQLCRFLVDPRRTFPTCGIEIRSSARRQRIILAPSKTN